MKIDTKKVGLFLKSIDDADYIYMRHCMGIRDAINELIKRHNLTKQDVCQRFGIKPTKYNDYIKGNYNYSVKDMAAVNVSFIELESKKLEEEVPFNTAKK